MQRFLITGGSGFIGTNLVGHLLDMDQAVLSIDVKDPQEASHRHVFRHVDVLDRQALTQVIADFKPTHVVHLAARTDLAGSWLREYEVNFAGVQSLIEALASCTSVERCLFMSSKLVCRTGYEPRSCEDYHPDTLYGRSKMQGENVVRSSRSLRCTWLIARPTSIWGPWFGVPYQPFFRMIVKGLYFHPGLADPPKSFGYIGNIVFQIDHLMKAPREVVHAGTFYLSDYEPYTIRHWANTISLQVRGKHAHTIPESLVRLAAWGGDRLQKLGVRHPPMTSFRLRNMRAGTTLGVILAPIRELTGPLPYSLEQGVAQTTRWLRDQHVFT